MNILYARYEKVKDEFKKKLIFRSTKINIRNITKKN